MLKIRVSIVPSISQIVVTMIAKAREIMIVYFNICFAHFYCFAPTFKAIREAKALPKAMAAPFVPKWKYPTKTKSTIILMIHAIKTNNKGVLLSPNLLKILLTTLYPTIKIIFSLLQ